MYTSTVCDLQLWLGRGSNTRVTHCDNSVWPIHVPFAQPSSMLKNQFCQDKVTCIVKAFATGAEHPALTLPKIAAEWHATGIMHFLIIPLWKQNHLYHIKKSITAESWFAFASQKKDFVNTGLSKKLQEAPPELSIYRVFIPLWLWD